MTAGRRRIAVVSQYAPGSRDAGEKVRLGALLEELAQANDVILYSWEQQADLGGQVADARYEAQLAPARLQVAGRLTRSDYAIAALTNTLVQWRRTRRNPGLRRWLDRQLQAVSPDVIVALQIPGLAALPKRYRGITLVDTHNAEGLRWRRIATAQDGRMRKIFARQQAAAARRLERRMGRQVRSMVTVSEHDSRYFEGLGCRTDLVGNGFRPPTTSVATTRPKGKLTRLLFVGSFDYSANLDALSWIVEIGREMPEGVSITIVGSGDPRPVRTLFTGSTNVHVVGRLDDVSAAYASHDVLIVPLRMGGGSRLKVLEGIAHGVVVVSTAVGVEGLPLLPGEDYLRAEQTSEWVKVVARLQREPWLAVALRARASAKISSMTWTSAGEQLRRAIDARF